MDSQLDEQQAERAQVLRDIVRLFGLKPSTPGGAAWGKGNDWMQNSLRFSNGLVTELRMSNSTQFWPEGLCANGKDVLYHLPGSPHGIPHPGAVRLMQVSRGRVVSLRVTIFARKDRPSEDFEVHERFVIDPTYTNEAVCRLAFF